jgi:hypothetical protein
MALLAEELVEEWLNREGFFTIRGIRIGVHEMDLLAIRPSASGIECRHVEVQASVNPMSYLFQLSKDDQVNSGRSANSSAEKSVPEIERGADDWVKKKFLHPKKLAMLAKLAPGPWTKEVVVHRLKHREELSFLEPHGVIVHFLDDVIARLATNETRVKRAAGGDLVDLVFLGKFDRKSSKIVAEAIDDTINIAINKIE